MKYPIGTIIKFRLRDYHQSKLKRNYLKGRIIEVLDARDNYYTIETFEEFPEHNIDLIWHVSEYNIFSDNTDSALIKFLSRKL